MIDAHYVRELFDYDPSTGELIFKRRQGRKRKGMVAGSLCKRAGYVDVGIKSRVYKAHRIIWLWMTGEWPSMMIDHKNRVRSDNRWENLRLADDSQNNMNKSRKRNKRDGLPLNVFEIPNMRGRRWMVLIRGGYYGSYPSVQQAADAAERIRQELYGEYAVATQEA